MSLLSSCIKSKCFLCLIQFRTDRRLITSVVCRHICPIALRSCLRIHRTRSRLVTNRAAVCFRSGTHLHQEMLIKSSTLSVNSTTSEASLMFESKEAVVLNKLPFNQFSLHLLVTGVVWIRCEQVFVHLTCTCAAKSQDACYYWTQAAQSGKTRHYRPTQKSMIVFQGLDHFWQLEKETFNQIISHSHPPGFGCFLDCICVRVCTLACKLGPFWETQMDHQSGKNVPKQPIREKTQPHGDTRGPKRAN